MYSHHITVYCQEGPKYNHIPPKNLVDGTVATFLDFFSNQRWITNATYEKRVVELRFVYHEDDIVSLH